MSGPTRGVLRSAAPAAARPANDLKIEPIGLGSSYGHAPAPTIVPTTTSATKYARWRQRTVAAATRPATGTANVAKVNRRSS